MLQAMLGRKENLCHNKGLLFCEQFHLPKNPSFAIIKVLVLLFMADGRNYVDSGADPGFDQGGGPRS